MGVFIEVAVGEAQGQIGFGEADAIAEAARRVGAAGLRIVDQGAGRRALDPSVVAAHLAGRYTELSFLADIPTTHNAPYNLARRVLSFDRATDGRAGVVLRLGGGDEVSDGTGPRGSEDADPAQRWAEYAHILTRLWESFPLAALIGDREGAVGVDDKRIRPIDHEGTCSRVAGPLDGPASAQGRPALIAADPELLGWARVAAVADAVIVGAHEVAAADIALTKAAGVARRRRRDIALLARVVDPRSELAATDAADGIVLAASADDLDSAADLFERFGGAPSRTLRSALGLREVAEVMA